MSETQRLASLATSNIRTQIKEEDDEDEVYYSSDADEYAINEGKPLIFEPRGSLQCPKIVRRSLEELMNLLDGPYLDLDPEYQRGVVWAKPRMVGLINSLLDQFYIPPIIFNVKRERLADGSERFKRICVDGKQRLSSIQAFMKGQIPCTDKKCRNWYYCPRPGDRDDQSYTKRRLVLPDDIKKEFRRAELVCYEFTDLTREQEEDLFSRVQLGMQLTPAEKLRATTGPWQDLARLFDEDFREVVNLCVNNRASSFRHILCCFAQILEVQHPTNPNGKPSLRTSAVLLERLCKQNHNALDHATKSHLAQVFTRFKTLVEKDAQTFKNNGYKTVKTFAPLELVAVAVLISIYGSSRNDTLLLGDIRLMRKTLRENLLDLRLNSHHWARVWEFLDKLEKFRGAVDGSTFPIDAEMVDMREEGPPGTLVSGYPPVRNGTTFPIRDLHGYKQATSSSSSTTSRTQRELRKPNNASESRSALKEVESSDRSVDHSPSLQKLEMNLPSQGPSVPVVPQTSVQQSGIASSLASPQYHTNSGTFPQFRDNSSSGVAHRDEETARWNEILRHARFADQMNIYYHQGKLKKSTEYQSADIEMQRALLQQVKMERVAKRIQQGRHASVLEGQYRALVLPLEGYQDSNRPWFSLPQPSRPRQNLNGPASSVSTRDSSPDSVLGDPEHLVNNTDNTSSNSTSAIRTGRTLHSPIQTSYRDSPVQTRDLRLTQLNQHPTPSIVRGNPPPINSPASTNPVLPYRPTPGPSGVPVASMMTQSMAVPQAPAAPVRKRVRFTTSTPTATRSPAASAVQPKPPLAQPFIARRSGSPSPSLEHETRKELLERFKTHSHHEQPIVIDSNWPSQGQKRQAEDTCQVEAQGKEKQRKTI